MTPKSKLKWENTQLEIGETLKKGEYEEILKYVEENERTLMSEVATHGLSRDARLSLKYGSGKMGYFEKSIEEDDEKYALFKLGELYGHINCLNKLVYEEQWNSFAKAKLTVAKTYDRVNPTLLEDVIKYLHNCGKDMTAKKLADVLSSKESEVQTALNILVAEGFVHNYEDFGYSLSDLGRRIGKLLKGKSN